VEISKAIEQFLTYLKQERKYSAHTLTSYQNDLKQMLQFLTQEYDITSTSDLSQQILRTYLASLKEQKYSATSINRKLSAVRSLYKFLNKNELESVNPIHNLKSLKKPSRLPVVVEKHKLNDLLEQNLASQLQSKDYRTVLSGSVLFFLYHTGVRASEILNLKMADVDFSQNQLKVLGKGNKERIIPITHELAKVLQENYLPLRYQVENSELFFVFETGKKLYHRWLYNSIIENLNLVTTQDKKSPHVLRHTFATHLLDEGADLNAIKELLGHANLSATQVYAHNSMERLKKVHSLAHPKYRKN